MVHKDIGLDSVVLARGFCSPFQGECRMLQPRCAVYPWGDDVLDFLGLGRLGWTLHPRPVVFPSKEVNDKQTYSREIGLIQAFLGTRRPCKEEVSVYKKNTQGHQHIIWDSYNPALERIPS